MQVVGEEKDVKVGQGHSPGEELFSRLAAVVGPDHVSASGSLEFVRDWWPLALKQAPGYEPGVPPWTIVTPGSGPEVAAALGVCAEQGVPVTLFGGGSGVVGGAIPAAPGVLLDLRRLNRIGDIDPPNLLVTAEAGVLGGDLERTLRAQGLTLGLYPQSLEMATVGGWVATRATGTYSGLYGGIESRLAGLEVALADGSLARTPVAPRWAVGPDLAQLFVGSEGTLGAVTEVTLKVERWPEERLLRACLFPDLARGLHAVRAVVQGGLKPAVVRLYDPDETARLRPLMATEEPGCLLLLAFDGPSRLVEIAEELTLDICVRHEAIDLGRGPATRWDEARLHLPSGFAAVREPGVLADFIDVQAPWSRLDETYQQVRTVLLPYCSSVMAHFSHVYGQGSSIYFVITITAPDDPTAIERYRRAWDAVMSAVLASGGSIAHHHGVGLARSGWVEQALGDAWPLWRRLKQAFDPAGLLNRGKLGDLVHDAEARVAAGPTNA